MDCVICRLSRSSLLLLYVRQTIYRINHLFQNGRALLKCQIFLPPTLLLFSGAWGKVIHEKNLNQKSLDTVLLIVRHIFTAQERIFARHPNRLTWQKHCYTSKPMEVASITMEAANVPMEAVNVQMETAKHQCWCGFF